MISLILSKVVLSLDPGSTVGYAPRAGRDIASLLLPPPLISVKSIDKSERFGNVPDTESSLPTAIMTSTLLHKLLIIFTAICALTISTRAAVLITPVGGAGTATGSGSTSFSGMFDSQPAGIPPIGTTTDPFVGSYGFFGITGRTGYIDFGVNFANITLEQTIIGLKQFGSASTLVLSSWWSDASDATFDGSDAVAPDFGIFSTASANSNKQWVQTWTGSVPVAKRYLLLQYTSGSESNRQEEVVFGGSVVPEPATVALLAGAGTFLMVMRRRRG